MNTLILNRETLRPVVFPLLALCLALAVFVSLLLGTLLAIGWALLLTAVFHYNQEIVITAEEVPDAEKGGNEEA